MFGSLTAASLALGIWLNQLKQAEPNTKRGALIAKNLEEDPSVPKARRDKFCKLIETEGSSANGEEAGKVYRHVLKEMDAQGYGFDSNHNAENRRDRTVLPNMGRAVDIVSFISYNLGGVTLPVKARSPAFQETVANAIKAGHVAVGDLHGDVAGKCAWAADAGVFRDASGGLQNADDTRDRLGLDDPTRFGPGKRMVSFFYSADKLHSQYIWRPTVLDAGWHPAAGAFLPSDPDGDVGKTQNLRTGASDADEIIHQPFPANTVDSLDVSDMLKNEPSTGYRDIRIPPAGATP